MEAVLLHPSPDNSISPNYKHIKGSRKNNRPFISRPSDQKIVPWNFNRGLLQAPPPPLSFSYPPSSISLRQQPQQPPLLPLPFPIPISHHRSRGLSCPPTNRKTGNRSRDQCLTPKKPAKAPVSPKIHDSKPEMKPATRTAISSEKLIGSSVDPLGPDPKGLPKDVPQVLSSIPSGNYIDLEKFSGSVIFTVSPPPSSLPLPTFPLRQKLSCNAEAAGIDAGATDNLRRLLRLR